MAYNRLSLEEKLTSKAEWRDGCLVFTGQRDRKGYGILRLDGKLQRAHRLMYELTHGKISTGGVVRHTCDQPSCINPAHLVIGSQADNVRDMFERNRQNKAQGEACGQSKLTPSQVIEIRQSYIKGKYGGGAGALAKRFGVSKPSVQAILRGDTWRHLP